MENKSSEVEVDSVRIPIHSVHSRLNRCIYVEECYFVFVNVNVIFACMQKYCVTSCIMADTMCLKQDKTEHLSGIKTFHRTCL